MPREAARARPRSRHGVLLVRYAHPDSGEEFWTLRELVENGPRREPIDVGV